LGGTQALFLAQGRKSPRVVLGVSGVSEGLTAQAQREAVRWNRVEVPPGVDPHGLSEKVDLGWPPGIGSNVAQEPPALHVVAGDQPHFLEEGPVDDVGRNDRRSTPAEELLEQ